LTFEYIGLVNDDTHTEAIPVITTDAKVGSNVGVYDITLAQAKDQNYHITLKDAKLEITPAALTIKAEDKSKVYGEENPELTFEYIGLVNDDTHTEAIPEITTDAKVGSNVGVYDITLAQAKDQNYHITLKDAKLEITPAALTIKAEDKSKVYGEENPKLTFVDEGLVNGDTQTEAIPEITTDAKAGSNVGVNDITLAQAKDQNYHITLKDAKLEITPAALTIKAVDKSKVYGEENPKLTFVYEGLVNGDTQTEAIPEITTDAKVGSNVGIYDIVLAQAKDQNYTITLEDAKLEITPAALTIKAEDKSKVYGEENPKLTFVYEGLVNGDTHTEAIPEITTDAKVGSNVGIYDIVLAQAKDQNYTITLEDAKLEITPAALTIKAEDKSKVYGEENPKLTFVYEGLVNGDTHTEAIPEITTDAKVGSNVGIYDIVLAQAKDQNYTITLEDAKLEITPAALTIKAEDKSKVYGDENPKLTFVYEGLVNGDTQTEAIPVITTDAKVGSNVGVYDIKLAQANDQNYTITLEDAKLEITPAALTIKAEDKSKVYGEENPKLTFVYEGLVNGDTNTEAIPVITMDAKAVSNVGFYDIVLAQAKDQNYTITLEDAKLEITPAALTIKAEDKSKVYGEENPKLTFAYEGLVNGDTQTDTAPVITTKATSGSSIGIYEITLAGAKDQNYKINLENAQLEITPADLFIKVTAGQGKIYGQQDKNLEFNVKGLMANDGEEVFTGTLIRENGELPGEYNIERGSLSAGNNYVIRFESGVFHISAVTVEMIMDPADVEAAWGQLPEMPEMLVVMSQDGRFLEIPVTWDFSQADNLARGVYTVTGSLQPIDGVINPKDLFSTISFTVLPKGKPEDLTMSNDTFKGSIKEFFIHVAHLTVIDPLDDIHFMELVEGVYDNGYFELIDNSLYWSSAERVAGKTTFTIQVRITDRDGNELLKSFVINRSRLEVDEITIYNTFTPDGDGVNDDWGINDLRFYSGVSISVFERSGKRVFYTEDPDQRWDGTFNNINLASGTYYYVVEIKELNKVRKGMLTILKK
ncbi:gliding motility-associated C-terminal domain-containing protein, partial [Litoribacter alkaliphilus]